jgi:organic hydroperoxide reductase OsmC/OhrA
LELVLRKANLISNTISDLKMGAEHSYRLTIKWTGNKGVGTLNYNSYERSHSILVENKIDIPASSDPAFRGDNTKHNPEELLIASLSSCHMLWFLHLCAVNGIIVLDYTDHASGIMTETADGAGKFKEATLNPMVIVTENSMVEKANAIHKQANKLCFIANSVNFPVHHKPICRMK